MKTAMPSLDREYDQVLEAADAMPAKGPDGKPEELEAQRETRLQRQVDSARRTAERANGARQTCAGSLAVDEKQVADLNKRLAEGLPSAQAASLLEEKANLERKIQAERSELALLTSRAHEAQKDYQTVATELDTLRSRRTLRAARGKVDEALANYATTLAAAEGFAMDYGRAMLELRNAANALAAVAGAEVAGPPMSGMQDVLNALTTCHDLSRTWPVPAHLRRRIIDLVGC